MRLDDFRREMLPAVEKELVEIVRLADGSGLGEMHQMLRYHLGWEGDNAGEKSPGKRIRPLLVLLSTAALGGHWKDALPAAAAVELIHNFSLIHDDIQDKSELRRGRETLWMKWGIAQAINAGDAMFSLAHIGLEGLEHQVSVGTYAQAARLLPRTSLQLTQGQYLDLAYENADSLTVESYWPMVRGKTAMLLSTSTRLGALVANAKKDQTEAMLRFGEKLGMAFQVHDDLLGIWGNSLQTGKSISSDLDNDKKSLPVIYALEKGGQFAELWVKRSNRAIAAEEMARALEEDGAKHFAEEKAEQLTQDALSALKQTLPEDEAGSALRALAFELVQRTH